MTRIWRYVLAHDNGMAPCTDGGLLSLCCCKPVIRRHAVEGDWVIGFVPKRFGFGKMGWAGKVQRIVSLGEYQRIHPARRDAIYKLADDGPPGENERLIPLRSDYHADGSSRRRDLRGRNALLFDPFWYFGGYGVQAPPEVSELAHYYVGQSTKRSTPEAIAALRDWLASVGPAGVYGEPREDVTLTAKPCGGCGGGQTGR